MITQAENMESLAKWFPLISFGLFLLGSIIGTLAGYKLGFKEGKESLNERREGEDDD